MKNYTDLSGYAILWGGSVAERLERWTCNLNARSSIPTNDRQLDLFVVVPSSTPQPH